MLGTCKGSWAEPFIVCGTFPTQRWRLRVDGLSGRGQRMRLDPGAQRAEGSVPCHASFSAFVKWECHPSAPDLLTALVAVRIRWGVLEPN